VNMWSSEVCVLNCPGLEGSVKTEVKPNHELSKRREQRCGMYIFIYFCIFFMFCDPGHYPFKVLSHFMQGMCP
jgi:hypothetical protein